MSDQTPAEPADLTPAQEESVRRLLAQSRVTEPMPEDVRHRLDDVLRELSAPNIPTPRVPAESTPGENVVVDLAARRRRRARNFLIAAAAVVVIGVAVPQVFQSGLTSASDESAGSSTDAGVAADDAEGETTLREDPAAAESAPESAPGSTPSLATPDASADKALPRVRPKQFAADAAAVRDRLAGEAAAAADLAYRDSCLAPGAVDAPESTQIPVRYAKREALLVLGPVANGSQRASVYVCGEVAPRRTALLEAR